MPGGIRTANIGHNPPLGGSSGSHRMGARMGIASKGHRGGPQPENLLIGPPEEEQSFMSKLLAMFGF